ncbi:MAG TPA: branched-chain amino acid ABC transporter substrate-binding protein [Burkholderiaceae bacterium]|nr:branched-chain amino acid ABC transporter substrate-binding protein [Burkholderiaceae bacterium]
MPAPRPCHNGFARPVRWAASSALAAAVSLANPAPAQPPSPQTVRIGIAGPLSGGAAHSGKDNENGARLAIEDLNRKAMVVGGHALHFELQSEDDQGDPKQATVVALKLCDGHVAGVVGHYNSGATIPASRVYHDCGLPLVNASSSSPQVTRLGFETTFRIISNDEVLGDALARYAVEGLKASRIAVVDDRTAYGQAAADQFARAVQARGIAVVDRQYTTTATTDFAPVITALKAKRPEVVFYGGLDAQAGPLLRQMHELGLDARLMGSGGVCTLELARLAGAENVDRSAICTTGGGLVSALPGGVEFEKRYRAAYDADVQAYAPFTYDAVMLIADAMTRAGSTEPQKYLPALAKTDYAGITGRIRFNDQGDIVERPVMLITFSGGKRVLLQEMK